MLVLQRYWPFRSTGGTRLFQSICLIYCAVFFLMRAAVQKPFFFPTCRSLEWFACLSFFHSALCWSWKAFAERVLQVTGSTCFRKKWEATSPELWNYTGIHTMGKGLLKMPFSTGKVTAANSCIHFGKLYSLFLSLGNLCGVMPFAQQVEAVSFSGQRVHCESNACGKSPACSSYCSLARVYSICSSWPAFLSWLVVLFTVWWQSYCYSKAL